MFEEGVRRDVGEVCVQMVDVTLGSTVGEHHLRIFAPTSGLALALEHSGDLYSCDHFVEPDYLLSNILEVPLIELVASDQPHEFGLNKRDTLPRCCRECDVRFACHGKCPRNRFIQTPGDTSSPSGEEGLTYLCGGYKLFGHHVDRPMRLMADLLRRNRAPSEIVLWYVAEDDRLPQPVAEARLNDPRPCGSGKAVKRCHGRRGE